MTEVKKISWKNLEGIQLENDIQSVVILPSLGGKIASLYRKDRDFEFAEQYAGEQYRMPSFGSAFPEYDASGLDDAFPNIDRSDNVTLDGCTYTYPDHGEIWSSSFETELLSDGVKLSFESAAFSYSYIKCIRLSENRLLLDYEIENTGEKPFPCIWAFHGLMRYEEDMEFLFAPDVQGFWNVADGVELGPEGSIHERENSYYDFSKVPDKKSQSVRKYYANGPCKEGFCGYHYPSQQMECFYHYDAQKLPYLGIWITSGGFRGDYNCALEPANGFYDDIRIAEKNQQLYRLKKGEPLQFTLEIETRSYKKS